MPIHDLGHLLLVGGGAALIVSALSVAFVAVRRRQY